MADHIPPMNLAMAAMLDVIARAQTMQSAIVRGAGAEEVESLRCDGMAAAEAYLDHMAAAGRAVRQIAEP